MTQRLDILQQIAFREWYKGWADYLGLNPDPDDAQQFYDYREAFLNDARPRFNPDTGHYHWPSKYKMSGHPNMIVDGINTKTEQRVE